ncbi:MAG: hypothetical protein OES57_01745 [Acidimicrobiia bacterium]|nr:hypothetical protein [Acidimicrobiia bacterium]
MSEAPHPPSRQQVERWFIRRGLPHFIEDYSASEDIFTRASPFLALVLFTQLFLLFDPKVSGWAQVGVFVLGIAVVIGAFALVNRLRGRRWFALPSDIGWPELTAFVLVPPVLRVIASRDLDDLWLWTLVNLVILGLTYVVTSYALLPMLWWTLRHLWHQIGQLVQLVLKSLPLLLLFSAFLFLNAEIWQVATDIPDVFVLVVVAAFVAVGSGFILLALRHAQDNLNRFDSWGQVDQLCTSSPYAGIPVPPSSDPLEPPRLRRRAQFNLGLLLFVAQAIQVLLVAMTIGLFYVAFGLFTVREATILQWTTLEEVDVWWRASPFGHEIVLTRSLVVVATLIASFAGLNFAVSALIDETYRRDFREEITREMRESLAVRTRYVHDLEATDSRAA